MPEAKTTYLRTIKLEPGPWLARAEGVRVLRLCRPRHLRRSVGGGSAKAATLDQEDKFRGAYHGISPGRNVCFQT